MSFSEIVMMRIMIMMKIISCAMKRRRWRGGWTVPLSVREEEGMSGE